MSLLRQRATALSFAETVSAFSPAEARLRLVRATRSSSELAENELSSQAKVGCGCAIDTTDVTANNSEIRPASRRVEEAREADTDDMRWTISVGPTLGAGVGSRVVSTVGIGSGAVCRAMVRARVRPGYRRVRWGLRCGLVVQCALMWSVRRTGGTWASGTRPRRAGGARGRGILMP